MREIYRVGAKAERRRCRLASTPSLNANG